MRPNDLGNTVNQWLEVTEIHALTETELDLLNSHRYLLRSCPVRVLSSHEIPFKEENIGTKWAVCAWLDSNSAMIIDLGARLKAVVKMYGSGQSPAMIAPPSLNGAASSTEPNAHARAEFNIAVASRRFEHHEAIGGGGDCQVRVVLGDRSSAQ